MAQRALVADVGGTNTRVALADGPHLLADSIRKFANRDHTGLDAVLASYVSDFDVACSKAAVAIAGPVHNGRGKLTNLDWAIDEDIVGQVTGAQTARVLNDLQAQGHAVGYIAPNLVQNVVTGQDAPPDAPCLMIGVGTGFNIAPVHRAGTRHVAASEAGHITLPARSDADLRLVRFLETHHGYSSVEDALSGRGLGHLYSWCCREAGDSREAEARTIIEACAARTDAQAEEAVALFVKILGRVAGDQALIHLPFGGIFLIGGVARGVSPFFTRFGFQTAFRDKGRFSSYMDAFSVALVEDDFAALHGLAAFLHNSEAT